MGSPTIPAAGACCRRTSAIRPCAGSHTVVGRRRRRRAGASPMCPWPGRTRWTVYDPRADAFHVNIMDPPQIVVVESADPVRIRRVVSVPHAGPHGLDIDVAAAAVVLRLRCRRPRRARCRHGRRSLGDGGDRRRAGRRVLQRRAGPRLRRDRRSRRDRGLRHEPAAAARDGVDRGRRAHAGVRPRAEPRVRVPAGDASRGACTSTGREQGGRDAGIIRSDRGHAVDARRARPVLPLSRQPRASAGPPRSWGSCTATSSSGGAGSPRTSIGSALALAQIMPGPLAAQLAIALGYFQHGVLGATAVGLAFVAAVVLHGGRDLDGVRALRRALVDAGALLRHRRRRDRDHRDRRVQARALDQQARPAAVGDLRRARARHGLGAGRARGVLRAGRARRRCSCARGPAGARRSSRRSGRRSSLGDRLVRRAVVRERRRGRPARRCSRSSLFFTKAGAFVFGSGLAIVPFLHQGVVQQFGWLNEQQFLDAVAVAMITPGPGGDHRRLHRLSSSPASPAR